jgi:hypothetical protein
MLTRTIFFYGLLAAVTELAILVAVPLPEIPLLRYVVFATSLIAAVVVVLEWYDAGATSPTAPASRDRSSQTTLKARFVQGRSPSAR